MIRNGNQDLSGLLRGQVRRGRKQSARMPKSRLQVRKRRRVRRGIHGTSSAGNTEVRISRLTPRAHPRIDPGKEFMWAVCTSYMQR